MQRDCLMWYSFLKHPQSVNQPFIDFDRVLRADTLNWYTDASGSMNLRCGGHYDNRRWFVRPWSQEFFKLHEPSIEFLELYAITLNVYLWPKEVQNRRIVLFCDNQSVVSMINSSGSASKNCHQLIRLITLQSMKLNVRIFAKHVGTLANGWVSYCLASSCRSSGKKPLGS